MIPVALAMEPADFDAKVRQPGLAAIDELVGRITSAGKKERANLKLPQSSTPSEPPHPQ